MSQQKSGTCSGENTILSCGASTGKVLDIVEASCEEKGFFGCDYCFFSCSESDVAKAVKGICQGIPTCTISTSGDKLKSTCEHNSYLNVEYNCIHSGFTATTEPSTNFSANETSLAATSVNTASTYAATSFTTATYSATTSDSTEHSRYATTQAFQGRLSSSLDTTTTVAIAISGAVVLLLILLLILVCIRRRRRMRASSDSRGIVEEVPNELYEMSGQFVANEANQTEEKQNELYHMDGGYASADETQIQGKSGQGDVVYTMAEDNPTAAYAVVTKPVTNV